MDFPVTSLIRATLRLAELGFLGFIHVTMETTPLWKGLPSMRGERGGLRLFFFPMGFFRRMAWFMVTSAGGLAWKERARSDDGST